MTREQEVAIVEAWQSWATKRVLSSENYLDFYGAIVRRSKSLRRLHVFEVLDVVMNTEYAGPHESRRSA